MADISVWQFGADAKLYYHTTADTALADMNEATAVIEVTVGVEKADADITTRGNDGWRGRGGGLKDLSIEITAQWRKDDEFLNNCRDAFLNNTLIDLCAMTGDRDVGGNEGPRGTFEILNISRPEPLEDKLVQNITAALQTYRDWEIIST